MTDKDKESGNDSATEREKHIIVGIDIPKGKSIPFRIVPTRKKSLSKKELRIRRIFTFSIIVVLITITLLYVDSFILKRASYPQEIYPDLTLIYTSPDLLLKGDQNVMDITITNLSQDQSFSGIVTLIFSDSNTLGIPIPDNDFSITIKDLHPNNRVTKQIKFTLPKNSPSEIGYYFQVFQFDGTPYISVNDTTYKSSVSKSRVFGFPYISTIVTFVVSGGFITTAGLWLDQIRKLLGLDNKN